MGIGVGIGVGRQRFGGGFVGLLDLYPSASVAFSLRRLSSTYTGNSIRVRRASDNSEQNIGFDALGNLDTTALATFCSGTDGFVTTWYDQSGNGRNATQITATNQPKIYDSSTGVILENLKPALLLDGTNDCFSIANFQTTNYSAFTLIAVIMATRTTGTNSIFCKNDTTGNNRSFIQSVRDGQWSSNQSSNGATTQQSRIDSTNNAPLGQNLFISISTLSQVNQIDKMSFYRNSVLTAKALNGSGTLGVSLFNASIPFEIGASNQGVSNFFEGDMQEVLFYDTNQSSNLSGIQSNINSHYAIY
jgi:hypothetical protein